MPSPGTAARLVAVLFATFAGSEAAVQAVQESAEARISGYVRSAETSDVIRGAAVSVSRSELPDSVVAIVSTNRFGYYSLSLPPGVYWVEAVRIGFAPSGAQVQLDADQTVDLVLSRRSLAAAGLTVRADRLPADMNPASAEMSTVRFSVPDVERLPVVLGETDPVRTLTLFPGVSTANDGTSAINVRGGRADENLIVLDNSQVFNPAHAIGFFSTFNSDAIDDVVLHKGAIPARFGGRTASVLEVFQREGNRDRFASAASIGLLSARASFEGPIGSGEGSWLVAGRRTYGDAFLVFSSDPDLKKSKVYFYDLNLRSNLDVPGVGTFLVSGFVGRDRLALPDFLGTSWGNAAGSVRVNRAFGPLFSNFTVSYSNYDYYVEVTSVDRTVISRIATFNAKLDQTLELEEAGTLEFGLHAERHAIHPGRLESTADPTLNQFVIDPRRAMTPAAYAEHEASVGPLTVRYGLRASMFVRTGPETVQQYENGRPLVYSEERGRFEPGVESGMAEYKSGDVISSYWGLEPRASVRLGLTTVSSLKLGYSRLRQELRLVSNSNSPSPLDTWDMVGPYLEPAVSDQLALGYVTTGAGGRYSFSAEAYGRAATGQTDFTPGADISFNEQLETVTVPSESRSWGIELLLRKHRGEISGWIGYSLARSELRTDWPDDSGAGDSDIGINGGDWYPSPYDRTHDLAAAVIWSPDGLWGLSANFVFATGLPTTFPVARYELLGVLLGDYGPRNGYRLPDYHRLDVSATRKFGRGELRFGVFNAYNRFNAQSMYFRQVEESSSGVFETEAAEFSLFGIVPSVSYRWSF